MASETLLGNGRYVVRGVLGEGAQGKTYDAELVSDGTPVAIKRFEVRGARSWKDVELAEREARVLASLDHPLVPRYIEHFEEDGALFLVMEKVEGESLQALRQREGALPEDEVRRFLADADRALTYLHGRASPIVHRDVKPRNVVRRPNGSYVLVDFGAVSELLHRKGGSTIVGTMGYMAPEQFQGRASATTDVYAVGATALAALTGVEPETLPHQGLRVDVRTALAGRASPALVASLEHMLEPDPDLRAKSLAAALDGVRTRAPSQRPPPSLERVPSMPPPAPSPPPVDLASEDAVLRSIRKLLWVLWGLSWIIVPLALGPFHAQRMMPIVMFGSLGLLFIVTWHRNAVLRHAYRAVTGRKVEAAPAIASSVRQRVDAGAEAQVRVHSDALRADEVVGLTEVQSMLPEESKHARARER